MTDEIEEAISAHMAWLKNIKTAVLVSTDIKKSNSDPASSANLITKIGSDHQCNFGKWLYNTDNAKVKESVYYNKTVSLHAQFHQQAAKILALAFDGKKSQAKLLIAENSEFIQCSEQLIALLQTWQSLDKKSSTSFEIEL
jgi:hypothetical protein